MDDSSDEYVPLPPVPWSVFYKGKKPKKYRPSHYADAIERERVRDRKAERLRASRKAKQRKGKPK